MMENLTISLQYMFIEVERISSFVGLEKSMKTGCMCVWITKNVKMFSEKHVSYSYTKIFIIRVRMECWTGLMCVLMIKNVKISPQFIFNKTKLKISLVML